MKDVLPVVNNCLNCMYSIMLDVGIESKNNIHGFLCESDSNLENKEFNEYCFNLTWFRSI